ncbi:hypothetical protein GGI05_001010, partial [Coemansia sp. RSA 2603]
MQSLLKTIRTPFQRSSVALRSLFTSDNRRTPMPSVGPTAKTKAAEPGFYVTFTDIGTKSEYLATITMNYPKANTFDYASLGALNEAIAKVEAKQGVRGLVLTSAIDGFFSGGFSLPVFQKISHEDFIRLWSLG